MRMRKTAVWTLLVLMATLALGGCAKKFVEPEPSAPVARPANDPAPETPKGKDAGKRQSNQSHNE